MCHPVQLQYCAYHWIQDHSNYHVEILVVDVLDLEGQKDVHGQVDLQGSSNPPYSGVINPMFSKCSTHGVIGGVSKRPFCV